MSRGHVIVWCVVSSVVTLGAITWVLTRNGVSARDRLSAPVDHVLQQVRMAAINADLQPLHNPLAGQPDAWREGGGEFQHDCAMCHGVDGRGDGPLAKRLEPAAPDLAAENTQHMSDAALYHVIADGVRLTGMPAWGGSGDDNRKEIWSFVSFIRHLPTLTPGEAHQLKEGSRAPSSEDLAQVLIPSR
jgi:mono/diheme cytochrome c family protein